LLFILCVKRAPRGFLHFSIPWYLPVEDGRRQLAARAFWRPLTFCRRHRSAAIRAFPLLPVCVSACRALCYARRQCASISSPPLPPSKLLHKSALLFSAGQLRRFVSCGRGTRRGAAHLPTLLPPLPHRCGTSPPSCHTTASPSPASAPAMPVTTYLFNSPLLHAPFSLSMFP
jgi:hypothetical protein